MRNYFSMIFALTLAIFNFFCTSYHSFAQAFTKEKCLVNSETFKVDVSSNEIDALKDGILQRFSFGSKGSKHYALIKTSECFRKSDSLKWLKENTLPDVKNQERTGYNSGIKFRSLKLKPKQFNSEIVRELSLENYVRYVSWFSDLFIESLKGSKVVAKARSGEIEVFNEGDLLSLVEIEFRQTDTKFVPDTPGFHTDGTDYYVRILIPVYGESDIGTTFFLKNLGEPDDAMNYKGDNVRKVGVGNTFLFTADQRANFLMQASNDIYYSEVSTYHASPMIKQCRMLILATLAITKFEKRLERVVDDYFLDAIRK